jgi:hypothetical protein
MLQQSGLWRLGDSLQIPYVNSKATVPTLGSSPNWAPSL